MTVHADFQHGRTYCIEWKIPSISAREGYHTVQDHLEYRGSDLVTIGGITEVLYLFLDQKTPQVWFIAQSSIKNSQEVV